VYSVHAESRANVVHCACYLSIHTAILIMYEAGPEEMLGASTSSDICY